MYVQKEQKVLVHPKPEEPKRDVLQKESDAVDEVQVEESEQKGLVHPEPDEPKRDVIQNESDTVDKLQVDENIKNADTDTVSTIARDDEFDWRDFDWYFGKDGPIVEAPTMRHSAGSANEGRPDPSPEKDKGKGNQVSTTKARIDEWLATEFGHRAEVNDAEGEQTLASDDELVSLRSSEPEALPLNMSELVDFRVVDRRVPVRVAPFSDAILRFCCAGATVQGIVYQVERHYEYSHWLKLHDGWIPIDGSGFRKLLEPIASDSSSAVTSETSRSSTPRAATSTSTRRRSDVFHEAGA